VPQPAEAAQDAVGYYKLALQILRCQSSLHPD